MASNGEAGPLTSWAAGQSEDQSSSTSDFELQFVDLGTPSIQIKTDLWSMTEEVVQDSPVVAGDIQNQHLVISDGELDVDPLDIIIDEVVAPDPTHALPDDLVSSEDDNNVPVMVGTGHEEEVSTVETIRVHRGHVLREMIDYYKHHDVKTRVEIKMILPNGSEEAGEDNGGVFRDAVTEFWEEFYEQYTVGETLKVPAIRHNVSQADWEACVKVLVVGYRQERYFPAQLARPFIESIMENEVSEDTLVDAYLDFIPVIEREVLLRGMSSFESIEEDELNDILEAHEVRVQVTEKNLKTVINEVAHKEIIQAPAYVANCWREVFVQELKPQIKNGLASIYSDMLPTTERVLKIIEFPDDMNAAQKATSQLLRRYIKSLSTEKLARFLRFTTGKYTFVTLIGFQTRIQT